MCSSEQKLMINDDSRATVDKISYSVGIFIKPVWFDGHDIGNNSFDWIKIAFTKQSLYNEILRHLWKEESK